MSTWCYLHFCKPLFCFTRLKMPYTNISLLCLLCSFAATWLKVAEKFHNSPLGGSENTQYGVVTVEKV